MDADLQDQTSCAFVFIFLSSIRLVRVALYEWFLNSHTLLAIAALAAAWVHVPPGRPAKLFLRIGICLWAIVTAIHWLLFAFRNFALRRPFARATATAFSDADLSAFRVDITVPRPWRVRAGQSIFLSIPGLGVFKGLRGHPFMISWWTRDGKGLSLSLLVQTRAGFTGELSRRAENSRLEQKGLRKGKHEAEDLLAFIDGPYGTPHNFGEYGTVVMIASGTGIAGHMPYIKDLIIGNINCEVRTRRVFLIWQMDRESEYDKGSHVVRNADQNEGQKGWVKAWIDEAFENDTGFVQSHPG